MVVTKGKTVAKLVTYRFPEDVIYEEPKKPERVTTERIELSLSTGIHSLKDILEDSPRSLSLEDVKVEVWRCEDDWGDPGSYTFFFEVPHEDEEYEEKLKEYETNLRLYNEQQERYNKFSEMMDKAAKKIKKEFNEQFNI